MSKWPMFEEASRRYLEFTEAGPIQKAGLRGEICSLWMDNIRHQMTANGR